MINGKKNSYLIHKQNYMVSVLPFVIESFLQNVRRMLGRCFQPCQCLEMDEDIKDLM